jgi:hypothetical protein
MPTEHILALLIAERDKLNRAIEALQGHANPRGRSPLSAATPASAESAEPAGKKRRTFTAAQRKKQAQRMKAYWAAKKAAEKPQSKAASKPKKKAA